MASAACLDCQADHAPPSDTLFGFLSGCSFHLLGISTRAHISATGSLSPTVSCALQVGQHATVSSTPARCITTNNLVVDALRTTPASVSR